MGIVQGRTASVRVLLVAATSATALIAPATAATAQQYRSYSCEHVVWSGNTFRAEADQCTIEWGDLPSNGWVVGDFEINVEPGGSGDRVVCTGAKAGWASLPEFVSGFRYELVND